MTNANIRAALERELAAHGWPRGDDEWKALLDALVAATHRHAREIYLDSESAARGDSGAEARAEPSETGRDGTGRKLWQDDWLLLSRSISDLQDRVAELERCRLSPQVQALTTVCPWCKGSGLVGGATCSSCRGAGVHRV